MILADKRRLSWALVACSVVLSAAGQLCMKAGMRALHSLGPIEGLATLAFSPAVVWTGVGLISYAVSMLAWLAVLTRYPLSLGYPLLSLSYVLVYIGATQWPALMESVTLERTAGTLLIAAGVAIVSLTGRQQGQVPVKQQP